MDSTLGFNIDAGVAELAISPETAAHEEDVALVEKLCAGSEAAYETLILRFEQPVYSIVSRLVDNPTEAPDIVQEVFLKVFRNVDGFRGDSSLKTWVYRIAVNEARNYRRWFGRHKRQETELDPWSGESHGLSDVLPDPGPSPFEVALDHETAALIEEALTEVGPAYRTALVLREVEGMSYEEISQVLEVSLGTVKSRILRGREALQRVVAGKLNSAPLAPELGTRGTQAV